MSEAVGWAVISSMGSIYVNSVSDTRRAAIVNWLVTEKQCRILALHSDTDIEALWRSYGQYADCRQVNITSAVVLHDGSTEAG